MSSDEEWRTSYAGHLETLQISSLAEWDVLVFVYRHGASLASAPQIAKLLGYGKATVAVSLDSLALKGLVQRSHNSQGVRLYEIAAGGPEDASRQQALAELMKVAEDRPARLLVARHLRADPGRKKRGSGGLHLASREG